MSLNKDYMDIDEFLTSKELCDELELSESDDVFTNITNPADFKLSDDQLHEYTANEVEIEPNSNPTALSPASSDEGQGKSISSDYSSLSDELTHLYDVKDTVDTGKTKTGKKRRNKSDKLLRNDSVESSNSRTSTWKVSKSDKQCVETSVEIEGVSYTYSLVPTAKARKLNRRPVPGDMKDEKYWDRRLKNNEAAKRSRDLRRQKEMLVASKAAGLEAENEELKEEVLFLRERIKILSKKLQENT